MDISEELKQLELYQGWLDLPAQDVIDSVHESMGCVHTAVSLLYERHEPSEAGFGDENLADPAVVGADLGDVALSVDSGLLEHSFSWPDSLEAQYFFHQGLPAGAVRKNMVSPDNTGSTVLQPVTLGLAPGWPSAIPASPALLQQEPTTNHYASYSTGMGLMVDALPPVSNAAVDSLFGPNVYLERCKLMAAAALGLSGPSSCLPVDSVPADLPQLLEQLCEYDPARQQMLREGDWGGMHGLLQSPGVWPKTPVQALQQRARTDTPVAALKAAASLAREANRSTAAMTDDRDLDSIMATLMQPLCR